MRDASSEWATLWQVKKTVLIVDDDPDILDSLSDLLEGDYEVRIARNGRDALDVVRREAVDAVVLDMMMPVLSGEGFLEEARRRGLVRPTIVITARHDLRERVQTLGAEYLPKPFAVAHLEQKLQRLLGPDGGGPSAAPPPGGGPASAGPGDADAASGAGDTHTSAA